MSPKASFVFGAIPNTELYVNFGTGFHSNDARGVTRAIDPATPLARAIGGEFGARTRLFDRVDLVASAFLLDLQSGSRPGRRSTLWWRRGSDGPRCSRRWAW